MAQQTTIDNVTLTLENTPDGKALRTNLGSRVGADEATPDEAMEVLMLALNLDHRVALNTLAQAAANTAETLHERGEAARYAADQPPSAASAGDAQAVVGPSDPVRAQQLRDDIHQLGFTSLMYHSGDRAQECWRHSSGACAVIDVQALRIIKFTTTNGLVETTTGELGWPNRNLAVFANQVITMARMAFNANL